MKLTLNEAQQIAGAVQQLNEIGSGAIIQPGKEAESKALRKYLQEKMVEYSQDFLTCFFVVATEYEPLVAGFAGLLRRGSALANRANKQEEEKQNGAGTPTQS